MAMPPYGSVGGAAGDGAPSVSSPTHGHPAQAASSAPLALAALIACLAAFVLGLVPLLGAVLGLVGIVLVVIAARRGIATKRTYVAALAAALGAPASIAASVAHAPQDERCDDEHNSVGFAGDGESDCPVLDPLVADDEVKLWITIGGSVSYDTQIGGSTTVPAYLIADAELQ